MLRLLRISHYPLTWGASFAGGLAGTFSHVPLDALMHPDIKPWWPLGDVSNPLLGAIDVDWLHIACAACAVVGGAILAWRGRRNRRL